MTAQTSERQSQLWRIAIPGMIMLAFLLRILLIPYTNYDTDGYVRWYDFIVTHGVREALGRNFAIYTPPYLYLLSLATLAKDFLPKLVAIKLIPIFFDAINAFLVFRIVRLKHSAGNISLLAAAAYLLAPTVLMNSALWGQIDSFYTCFLLLTVFLLLADRPLLSMAAFGLAVSVKAQAVFLLPFLLLMALKKRIPWYAFGMVPLAYFAAMLPAIAAGRTVRDVFTIYLNQAAELEILSHNAPNWYIFVPQSTYPVSMPMGMALTAAIIAAWMFIYLRRTFPLRSELLLLAGLVSVALMPFLLPKMHDRYFYPADVFSILLAFALPQFWFIPLCYQAVSTLVYSIFLFGADRPTMLILATLLNTVTLFYLLWKQFQFSNDQKSAL